MPLAEISGLSSNEDVSNEENEKRRKSSRFNLIFHRKRNFRISVINKLWLKSSRDFFLRLAPRGERLDKDVES